MARRLLTAALAVLIAILIAGMVVAALLPYPVLAGLGLSRHVTLVLGHPTRLDVTRYEGNSRIGSGATSNRALVASIVDVVNKADVPSGRAVACPALPGKHSTLRFHYRNGDIWTVYFDGCWGLSTHGRFGTALGDPPVYGTLPGLLQKVAPVRSSGS